AADPDFDHMGRGDGRVDGVSSGLDRGAVVEGLVSAVVAEKNAVVGLARDDALPARSGSGAAPAGGVGGTEGDGRPVVARARGAGDRIDGEADRKIAADPGVDVEIMFGRGVAHFI